MTNPFFSIIIPSFNSERFIGDAIRSVLAQTFRDIEVIVVDQSSQDRTVSIVQEFAAHDPRVRYANQTGEKGPARARNQGLQMATGRYVSFFDSDNILLPEACATVKKLIDAEGERDVYFSDMRYFETGRPERLLAFTVQCVSEVTLEELVHQNFINLLGTFLRREVVAKFGGFDNRFRTCEEHILWLRLVLWAGASFRHIPKVLGHLRFHVTNLTWRPSYFVEAAETNFVIYGWLEKEIAEKIEERRRGPLLARIRALRAQWLFRAGLGGIVLRDRQLARNYFDRWMKMAGKSAVFRALLHVVLAVAPLAFLSPLIMYFRRRFVMRRYVSVSA